jgi:hypothetical protein
MNMLSMRFSRPTPRRTPTVEFCKRVFSVQRKERGWWAINLALKKMKYTYLYETAELVSAGRVIWNKKRRRLDRCAYTTHNGLGF